LDLPSTAIESVFTRAHSALITENRDDALILRKEYEGTDKLVLTMIVLEPDRSIAEFCGNGARVVTRYLQHKYGDAYPNYYLKTSLGLRKVWWNEEVFHVNMGKTTMRLHKNPFLQSNYETLTLGLGLRHFTFFWTQTIEPHLVTFDAITEEELTTLGLYVNHHQRAFFPCGINLNSAEVLEKNSLQVTTFERGVNRITAACGTGATSSAMLAQATGRIEENTRVNITLKGGNIVICPTKQGAVMSGPATIDGIQ
jgi:diaminopimelate epimerase